MMDNSVMQQVRQCIKCGQALPATSEYFHRDKSRKDGLDPRCKPCRREDSRRYNARHQEERKESAQQYHALHREELNTSSRQYYAQHQEELVEYARKYREANQEKVQERRREHYRANPEKYRECSRKYYHENTEKCLKEVAQYRIKHREECKKSARKYRATHLEECKERDHKYGQEHLGERREASRRHYNQPTNRLSNCISRRIRYSLKEPKNGRSWESLVGYTLADLMLHLESQFTKGMAWENYGRSGWHVDHIKPISHFNFESYDDPEFLECWALWNLRPLWAEENLSRGNRVLQHPLPLCK